MSLNGFLHLSRRAVQDFGWTDDPIMFALFHHLLLNAAYKDCDWHGVKLKRGQVIFGRQEWAKRTGISEQSLRTCINRLKSTGQLTSESTNKFTVLTIVKYDEFVGIEEDSTIESTGQLTNNQPATNQQLTTSEESKEIKHTHTQNASARDPLDRTRLPHLDLPEDWKTWAMEKKNWDKQRCEDVWTKFHRHWSDKIGFSSTKPHAEWPAAWRDWCANERSIAPPLKQYPAGASRVHPNSHQKVMKNVETL